jgi:hypothetical protein
MKTNILYIFKDFSKLCQENSSLIKTWQTNILHIFIISRSILLRMRNVSDKIFRENRNTHFMFKHFFLNRAVYDIM